MKKYFRHDLPSSINGPKGKKPTARKETVLLVDDDLAILEGSHLRLRARGYETLEATDGGQCVAMALVSKPDVIVMDVRMPRMDGLTALSELQKNQETKDIPVIILSASLNDRQAALDAGARFFLKKPYQGKDLVFAIESVLGGDRRGTAHIPPPKHPSILAGSSKSRWISRK